MGAGLYAGCSTSHPAYDLGMQYRMAQCLGTLHACEETWEKLLFVFFVVNLLLV